ncbi:hypothetical protein INT44_006965 [Umbelopsis vinacea]|uniref:YncI copper-binding domain-containing protein n=1 Tax=Umbelopsis vinacea TaxID=44442 RepID=A0A8H7PFH5_9FUNG|nr:hypothetical protein INT44_006965 [Umbelopsis vinacea]KAI9282940.1 hypothetical protein BC943DRAFT_362459 [Umbelopsis sp. AD052]
MQTITSLLAGLCLLSIVLQASAHVSFTIATGQPESYLVTALRVPHGCSGSATTAISVSVPDNVYSIKPEVVANWNLTIQYVNLTTPITVEGQQINQTVSNITWSNGLLPSDQFQEFGLQIQLPSTGYNNTNTLWFPVVQSCVNGTSTWGGIANTSSWNQYLGYPAPHIDLTNATSSSSAAQPSSTAAHSAGVSVSAGTASTLMFLLGTFVAMLA